MIAHNSEGEEGTYVLYTENWLDEEYGQESQGYEGYEGCVPGVYEDYYGYDEWGHDDNGQHLAAAAPALSHSGWDTEYYEEQEDECEEEHYGQTGEEQEEDDEEDVGQTSEENSNEEEDEWEESAGDESSAESQA